MSESKKIYFRDLRTGERFSPTAADTVHYYLARGENRAAARAAKQAVERADPVLRDIVHMLARQVSAAGDTHPSAGNPLQVAQARSRNAAFDLYRAIEVAYGLFHGKKFSAQELVHVMHWYFGVCPNGALHADIDNRLAAMTEIVGADIDGAHEALKDDAKNFLRRHRLSHEKSKLFLRRVKEYVVHRTGISAYGLEREITIFRNMSRSKK